MFILSLVSTCNICYDDKKKTLQRNTKQCSLVIFWLVVTCRSKMISIGSLFRSKFSFINLLALSYTLFLKSFERRPRSTGLLWCSKLVHLDAKNIAFLIQNSMRNSMNLVLVSRNDRKRLKSCKNQATIDNYISIIRGVRELVCQVD